MHSGDQCETSGWVRISTYILIVAVWTVLVGFFVGRHVLPECFLALVRRNSQSPSSTMLDSNMKCFIDVKAIVSNGVGVGKIHLTFLHMKAISLTFTNA